ncbi:MFS transporter [Embleya scabrispora]|uniref:MFS transporter n=1 Tax=Embleya scabrispora TaxID=159449 RepID=UPI00036FF95A|nr:MFS transporter [Embleya scabrispora]MYS86237.1 MFS transporter [Streptomyces sp. SID5474]
MFIYALVLTPPVEWLVPEFPLRQRHRLDVLGVLLLGGGAGLVLPGLSQGRDWGWWTPGTVASFGGGVLLLGAFAGWESRVSHPDIDVRLIVRPAMRMTLLASLSVGFLIGGYGLLMPQLLQTPDLPGIGYGAGLTATGVALWTFPQGLLTMACGSLGGVADRARGARPVLIAAGCLLVAALTAAAWLPGQRGQVLLIAGVFGAGMGPYHAAGPNLVVDAVPLRQSAVGTSMLPVANQLGAAAAATILGAVMARDIAHSDARTGRIVYADAAFEHAFAISAVVGLAGVLVAVLMRHGRAPAGGGAASAT